MTSYFFHRATLTLDRNPGPDSEQLQIATTRQHLGERHWWVCPTCGNRRKHLYYFIAGHAELTFAPIRVLACRACLGLTYASRSRHRCPDHDERQARKGCLKAAMRTTARIYKKHRGDIATLEAIRRRLYPRARALGVPLPADKR